MIEEIPAALDGERLDRVVAMLTGLSRSEASTLIAAGEVRVNGHAVTTRTHHLVEGDELALEVPAAEVPPLEGDASVVFSTVYADADLAVIDKPAGLVVHPGSRHPGPHARQRLAGDVPGDRRRRRSGPPRHRAPPGSRHFGPSGRGSFGRGLRRTGDRTDRSRGRARVRRAGVGDLRLQGGHGRPPIGGSPRTPTKMAVSARGKPARTRYEVRGEYHDPVEVSLLGCRLETGRTHQIRVHLAAIDHPVVGDDRYGGTRQSLPMDRPFLHAEHLRFAHPGHG